MKRILVVEDEPDIRELLVSYLVDAGYDVVSAGDGVEALGLFDETVDLVVLDILIPKIDGFGVCEVIRKRSDVPIIFLSALDDEANLIKGYDLEADDYVTKPFSMQVFLKKVRAILMRGGAKQAEPDVEEIRYKDVLMIPDKMQCKVGDREVELTSREYELLLTLIKHPGRVYTRDVLLDLIWDVNTFVDERIVDSHIKNLRHKLGNDIIDTVRGRGYRVAEDQE